MKYDLAALARRARNPRRKQIVLRKVVMPSTKATDLFHSGYAQVLAAWSQAIPAIMAQYQGSLAELTHDAPVHAGLEISQVEQGIAQLMITIRLRLERWAANVEQLQRAKWRGAVLSATGVDINTMAGASDMRLPIQAAIERNVGLIRSVSEQARTRIGEAVFGGLQKRQTAREVAALIGDAVDMGRRRALNIAADQTVKLTAALNDERRREAGLSIWEWIHSGKVHFRPEHLARNGNRYSDDPADNAPPPSDLPGELPFCGCTSRAVLSLDGEF